VVIAGVGLALVAGLWALASRSTSPTSIADPPPVTPLPPQPPAGGSDTVAPATPIDRTPERTGGAGSGTTIRLDTSTTANGKPTRDAKKPDEKKPDVKRDERTKVVVDSSKPKPEPVKPPAPTPTPAPVVPEPTPINKKQPDVKPTPDPTPPKPAPVAVVESIEDGEARTAVSGFIGTLAQPNANFGELATFLRDGNDPKFVLLNGPTTQTESGGRRTVQFIVKVTQFNAVGIQQTRRAMFSMDLTKSGGRVSWDKVRLISFVR
jgi:hypothetical protein